MGSDRRLVTPRKASEMSPSASLSKKTIAAVDLEDEKRHYRSVRKVDTMNSISLRSESFVLVVTKAAKTYILELRRKDCTITIMLIAKVIVEMILNRPLYIMVSNLWNSPISVLKDTKLAELSKCLA